MGNGVGWRLPTHPAPKIRSRQEPILGLLRMLREHVEAVVAIRLRSIHPNPGPGGRDKSERGRAERMARKRATRESKRQARTGQEQGGGKEEINVVAWNVQRMSLTDRRREKARGVVEYARRCRWDAVLLSEVRAERGGVVWMGDEEERVVIVHSEKAGVLLRGELVRRWCEEGMVHRLSGRTVSVKVRGMVLVATYLPVSGSGNAEEVEEELEVLGSHVSWAKESEVLVVGGDFNAHVGGGNARRGVCGRFGLRASNPRGEQLVEWCEANGLAHVASFYDHRRRGTWFSNFSRQWYRVINCNCNKRALYC